MASNIIDSADNEEDDGGGNRLEARLARASQTGDVAGLIYSLEAIILEQWQRKGCRMLVGFPSFVYPLFTPLKSIQSSEESTNTLHLACASRVEGGFVRMYLLLYIVANMAELYHQWRFHISKDVTIGAFLHRMLHVREMTYREWIRQLLVLRDTVPSIGDDKHKSHVLTVEDYDRCLFLSHKASSSVTKLLTLERVTLRQAVRKTHEWCRQILDDGTIRITHLTYGWFRKRRKPGSLFLASLRHALRELDSWMDRYNERLKFSTSYAPFFSCQRGSTPKYVKDEEGQEEQREPAVLPKRRKQKQQPPLPQLRIDDLDTDDLGDDDSDDDYLSSSTVQFEWEREEGIAASHKHEKEREVEEVGSIIASSSIHSEVSTWHDVAAVSEEESETETDKRACGSIGHFQPDKSMSDFSIVSSREQESAADSVMSSLSVWDDDAFWDEIENEAKEEEKEELSQVAVEGGWLEVMPDTRERSVMMKDEQALSADAVVEVPCGENMSIRIVDVYSGNAPLFCVPVDDDSAKVSPDSGGTSYRDVLLMPARNHHEGSAPYLRSPKEKLWFLPMPDSTKNTLHQHRRRRRRHGVFEPIMNTIEEEEEADFFGFLVSDGVKSMGRRRRDLMVRKGKKRGKGGRR